VLACWDWRFFPSFFFLVKKLCFSKTKPHSLCRFWL
jgi:hypothetical protein